MIITSIISLLLSNAVTLRRDISILFNRISILALFYCIIHGTISLLILNKGLALHGGLLHISNTVQIFHVFIFFISILILQLTSFYPRILWIPKFSWLEDLKKYLVKNYFFKLGEHMSIIEYPLILLFVISGAVFLISTNDLVSIFLSIELQSYGLYLLSTIYRNSELSTTGGLIYFLLGGLSSCFILLGSSLLYANSGTTNMDGLYIITNINDVNSWYKSYYINFSLLIFSIGFLFKISAAPAMWFRKSLWRVQLSNSGDTLKILIPNYNRKAYSICFIYTCMVISQNIFERLMGYRGSKSVVIAVLGSTTVKEQRVNGSYRVLTLLRATLMGFERNYQIKNLSKQINKPIRFYSTYMESGSTLQNKLEVTNLAWFFCGLVDGEGCFIISITKSAKNKVGWSVKLVFKLGLHKKEKALLEKLQSYLCVGNISSSGNCLHYRVESIKDLPIVIKFFDKHSLITKKHADYLLFKQAVNLVLNKEHITMEGLKKNWFYQRVNE